VIEVGIVVLARYNSSRLPGKALMEINGKAVLTYILERLETVVPKEQIVLATSTEKTDDPIVAFAEEYGFSFYRGSLEKVASRFYEAANTLNCQYACRINGDNLFLDAEVLRTMLAKLRRQQYDFISNVKERTFPKGMSVEIVKMAYYQAHLPTILASDYYTEHVMVYLYERAKIDDHFYLMNEEMPEAAGVQLALDTPADMERSRWILDHLEIAHTAADMKTIVELAQQYDEQA
jgi:spore coat polysaccharide biosynthesis protein SpsF